MNFNILLVKKIENMLEMSSRFDKLSSNILSETKLDVNSKNIYELTTIYVLIRAEHGGIIILNDKMKNEIVNSNTELNDDTIHKLYDLSTFTSIIENIANLVSNMDFQYKKIALMYPKFINKKPIHIILFTKSIDANDHLVKLIEDVKNLRKENEYHVVQCETPGTKINCEKFINRKLAIKVEHLPSIYIINDDNIVEVPIKQIKTCGDLINMID